jgi:hypothetical protein
MNDEIGLDEDIEPTADATEGVKGGLSVPSLEAEIGKEFAKSNPGAAKEATPLTSPKTGMS